MTRIRDWESGPESCIKICSPLASPVVPNFPVAHFFRCPVFLLPNFPVAEFSVTFFQLPFLPLPFLAFIKILPLSITLSDLRIHSPIASLCKCSFYTPIARPVVKGGGGTGYRAPKRVLCPPVSFSKLWKTAVYTVHPDGRDVPPCKQPFRLCRPLPAFCCCCDFWRQ